MLPKAFVQQSPFEGDDKVKIQTGGPGNERPTELKPADEAGPHGFVLTRKKD